MNQISNLPPLQRASLYRGDTPLLHIPLTLAGAPLPPDIRAAWEGASYRLQFRRASRSRVPLGDAQFMGFSESVNPANGLSEWGPMFRIPGPLSASLPAACVADLQQLSGPLNDPNERTLIQFEVDVQGDVTRGQAGPAGSPPLSDCVRIPMHLTTTPTPADGAVRLLIGLTGPPGPVGPPGPEPSINADLAALFNETLNPNGGTP